MLKKILSVIVLCVMSLTVYAAQSPIPVLQDVAKQLINELNANKAKLKNNPQIVYKIVEEVLIPHIDQDRMARSVVNRAAWDQATDAQRAAFQDEFKNLVIKTYSAAFTDYARETVKFYPIRGAITDDLEVKSEIVRPGKPNVSVTYRLEFKDGSWKVYDFSVEGISMVSSFRSQFAALSQNGLAPLTQALKLHNQKT